MSAHEFIDSGKSAKSLIGSRPDCPFIPVFGAPQVMFVKGKGTELWDSEGKRYLDFLCGLAVTSLGHSHDAISEAIASQASTLMHVSNFFANPIATTAAVELDALLGGGGQVFFCNSGAEANEAAIKLARKFGGRGRHTVVSAYGSFHGRTLAALAATGQPAKHEPFQPMPEGFKHVAYGDIDALAEAIDPGVAAVLLESVQGEGGVVPAPEGYLRAVRDVCTQRGVLLILDEVQTGLARTGKWWGFEHDDIEPDAVCVAKALGNGMPVGALWAKKEIAAVFQPGDHGSTYSGTAIATAAASAVMQEMKRINAPQMAAENGAYLSKAVAAMSRVKSVRGRGLLLGVELVDGLDAKAVQLNLLHKGLVTNAVTATALRLAPPLNVSDAEMDEAISIIATEVG
jgi:predicted acetylornithine/succinylornithine family transaminase